MHNVDLEIAIILLTLLLSLWTRPWRMLNTDLLTPLLASMVLLPWVWALPFLHHMPLPLHWSGAPMVTLMLGWPLATLVLMAIGLITFFISSASPEAVAHLIVWQGLIPATLTLLMGAALRRWVAHHPFVYVLGRGFFGSVICLFATSMLAQALGQELPNVGAGLSAIGFWLMAWSDAFVTGMLCAIFVAFKPHWLATWSDRMYLKQR